MQCTVTSITPLACNTYQIRLQPQSPISFKAGQYLTVVMGEQDKRPFSIANSPCRASGELELHIGAAEHNAYASEVVDKMETAFAQRGTIEIEAPFGDAWWQSDSERPLLLVAGGTGFSYVRSILDCCISQSYASSIYVYWGAKEESQLYAQDELIQIAQQHQNVHFIPVVESAPAGWQGKVGNVLEAIHSDFSALNDFDIYIAGRFEMAGAARELFTTNKGAIKERMFADAYAFI